MNTEQIIEELRARLNDIYRLNALRYPIQDEFEMGIDCRVANEQHWLTELLARIGNTNDQTKPPTS